MVRKLLKTIYTYDLYITINSHEIKVRPTFEYFNTNSGRLCCESATYAIVTIMLTVLKHIILKILTETKIVCVIKCIQMTTIIIVHDTIRHLFSED